MLESYLTLAEGQLALKWRRKKKREKKKKEKKKTRRIMQTQKCPEGVKCHKVSSSFVFKWAYHFLAESNPGFQLFVRNLFFGRIRFDSIRFDSDDICKRNGECFHVHAPVHMHIRSQLDHVSASRSIDQSWMPSADIFSSFHERSNFR